MVRGAILPMWPLEQGTSKVAICKDRLCNVRKVAVFSVQSARRQRRNDPMPRPSLELIADKRPMPSPIVVLRAVDRWLAHRPVRVLLSMRVAAGRVAVLHAAVDVGVEREDPDHETHSWPFARGFASIPTATPRAGDFRNT